MDTMWHMPHAKGEKPPSEQNELHFQNSGLVVHPRRSEIMKPRSAMSFGAAPDHEVQAQPASLKG